MSSVIFRVLLLVFTVLFAANIFAFPGDEIQPPSPPTINGPSTDSDGNYSIYWAPLGTRQTIKLYEKFNGGTAVNIYSGTASTYSITNNQTGTYTYYAQICYLILGCSSNSNIKTTVVTLPVPPTVSVTNPGTQNAGNTVSFNASASDSICLPDLSPRKRKPTTLEQPM